MQPSKQSYEKIVVSVAGHTSPEIDNSTGYGTQQGASEELLTLGMAVSCRLGMFMRRGCVVSPDTSLRTGTKGVVILVPERTVLSAG